MTDVKYSSLIALAEFRATYNQMWTEPLKWRVSLNIRMFKCLCIYFLSEKEKEKLTIRILASFTLQ